MNNKKRTGKVTQPDNWVTDLYGEEFFTGMLEEFTREEMWDVILEGKKYAVRVVQQENRLIIDMTQRRGSEMYDKIIPVGGFTLSQRKVIAQHVLDCMEAEMPIIWRNIISPMIKGYWDEEWDIIKVHDIDRSDMNHHYVSSVKKGKDYYS